MPAADKSQEILKLMSGEWISGEEHMSNVLTKTAASPMTRIIVGSVFNLRNVQNISNVEGDLKSAAMATLQEVQTDLGFPAASNKACPHLTVMNRRAVMPHRFAFSHVWSPFLFTDG